MELTLLSRTAHTSTCLKDALEGELHIMHRITRTTLHFKRNTKGSDQRHEIPLDGHYDQISDQRATSFSL